MATTVKDDKFENVAYDSKQKYVTVTSINHGAVDDEGVVQNLVVPPDSPFSDYADDFSDEEKEAFVLQGTIAPMSDVNSEISDENDALREKVAETQAEKEELNKKVAELEAALQAATKGQQNPPAQPVK